MLPDTSESTVFPSVNPPLKLIVPVLVTEITMRVDVNETAELKVIVPVETAIVSVPLSPMITVPLTCRVCAPTFRVKVLFLMLGFSVRAPVVPLITRLPPEPIVRVVFDPVALPRASDPQTAAVPIVRLTPELITASSPDVGTCPRLQVAPAQVAPALAVFVAAIACEWQHKSMSGKAAHRIRTRCFEIVSFTGSGVVLIVWLLVIRRTVVVQAISRSAEQIKQPRELRSYREIKAASLRNEIAAKGFATDREIVTASEPQIRQQPNSIA